MKMTRISIKAEAQRMAREGERVRCQCVSICPAAAAALSVKWSARESERQREKVISDGELMAWYSRRWLSSSACLALPASSLATA